MSTTLMPKKDYLAEMKRCSCCKRLKDKGKFHRNRKNKDGLRSACGECKNERARSAYELKQETKLRKLNHPIFAYQNGYTLNVIPCKDAYKIEICDEHEEAAVLLPIDRAELLRDWLDVKLKEKK